MGVQGMSTPYIRGNSNATNAKLNQRSQNSEHPVVIGFDISVMIISLMRQNSNMISLYHTEPKVPIPELTLKVITQLRSYFKHGMNKGVLVFDGLTHRLKKDHAHKNRYKNMEKNSEELQTLYSISSFSTIAEEVSSIARVTYLLDLVHSKI